MQEALLYVYIIGFAAVFVGLTRQLVVRSPDDEVVDRFILAIIGAALWFLLVPAVAVMYAAGTLRHP